MGQDLSIEKWDIYHQLKTIITTKPHINIPDNELKDLLMWVKMNFPNLDPLSVVTYEFWDIANWILYDSVILSQDQRVANLLPVCHLMLNIFQQLNLPVVSLAPQIHSSVPPSSQIGHAALSLPQDSGSSSTISQASPAFPLSGCSSLSHCPHTRGLYCLEQSLPSAGPLPSPAAAFQREGEGATAQMQVTVFNSGQHKCQTAPNLGDSLWLLLKH